MQRTFYDVDSAARHAGTDEESIRALTETILKATWFSSLQPEIHDRLFKAAFSFRTGSDQPITEERVSAAVNRLAADLKVPGFFECSPQQVRVFRMQLLQLSPVILSSPKAPSKTPITEQLTPAGAAYLGLLLFQQKVLNPEYQISSSEWITKMQTPRDPNDLPPSGFTFDTGKRKLPEGRLVFMEGLEADITAGSNRVVKALTTYFDTLGLKS